MCVYLSSDRNRLNPLWLMIIIGRDTSLFFFRVLRFPIWVIYPYHQCSCHVDTHIFPINTNTVVVYSIYIFIGSYTAQ